MSERPLYSHKSLDDASMNAMPNKYRQLW